MQQFILLYQQGPGGALSTALAVGSNRSYFLKQVCRQFRLHLIFVLPLLPMQISHMVGVSEQLELQLVLGSILWDPHDWGGADEVSLGDTCRTCSDTLG